MKLSGIVMTTLRRVLAISDLHVDYMDNLEIVKKWSAKKYNNDVLLVAGDVTDSMSLLKDTFTHLTVIFYKVFFVPGNHDLWIRKPDTGENSVSKFHSIISMCKDIGVKTEPELLPLSDHDNVWIIPLFSWYSTPEDDQSNSLFMENKDGVSDDSYQMWMDNHLCKWPDLESTRSRYFFNLNEKVCNREFEHPVISFSHFLPRRDLIKPSESEIAEMDMARKKLGLSSIEDIKKSGHLNPRNFNFSRYAGCSLIESQIRAIGSKVHVFGHQHRNKIREVEGVRYISHCLGYRRERDQGLISGFDEFLEPKIIWPKE